MPISNTGEMRSNIKYILVPLITLTVQNKVREERGLLTTINSQSKKKQQKPKLKKSFKNQNKYITSKPIKSKVTGKFRTRSNI